MANELTPMMRQYLEVKQQHKDAILFFRLGDFYEMFFEDAEEATRILHITLTSRGNMKGKKVPMCGVPYHAADNYVARLIKSGRKVAICDQVEEAEPGKKIVKREVTKVVTPGTFLADELLVEARNQYVLSFVNETDRYGVAYADISTGEFRLTEISDKEGLFSELYKIAPAETIIPESFSGNDIYRQFKDINTGVVTVSDDWEFDYALSLKQIKDHFMVESLEGFGCEGLPVAVRAAGALLRYLKNTQKSGLSNISSIKTYHMGEFMSLDRNSHRHLELTHNLEDLSAKGSLLEVLDRTRTPMGKRRLKRSILNPLINADQIRSRQDAVEFFYSAADKRNKARELLGGIYDMERLSNRISLGTASPRDMVALSGSLKKIKALKATIEGHSGGLIGDIYEGLDEAEDIIDMIGRALIEEAPVSLKDGRVIKKGYDTELDQMRELVDNGKDWVAELQKKEIERTGISSLKVGYNRVFGYYIEVTRTHLDQVPQDYIRKQTLVNAERFITQDLKEQETRIIDADDKSKKMEQQIFFGLRDRVGDEIERLKSTSDHISLFDMISGLSEVAAENRYVRPDVDNGSVIDIKNGRHPVLEKLLKDKEFVPNDVRIDEKDNRIFIITGSNMAGKSTLIRQVALICIMAQMGSFVPASEAVIGVLDRIFTRVGASDRLYKGMSTFMVEMLETANILNNATSRSLIILDEIGRGTSTFDGVSIAWAVVEHIHHRLSGAKALFATHYHELTELTRLMDGVKNYHLAVQEWGSEIVFLYRLEEGSCDESFGIHVAKLAGMPEEVVARSKEILDNLQKDSFKGSIMSKFAERSETKEVQYDLFDKTRDQGAVIRRLKDINIEDLTPLEALTKLAEIKKNMESGI